MSKESQKKLQASSMPALKECIEYEHGAGNKKYVLVIKKNVAKPNYYTDFLVNNIAALKNKECLEIGCGCGIISIIMANSGAKNVLGIDINSFAVKLSRLNAKLNGLNNKIIFLTCDFLNSKYKKKFDLIVTSPPNIPTPNERYYKKNKAFFWTNEGGVDGRKIVDGIITKVYGHLKPHGVFQILIADFIGVKKTIELLKKNGFISVSIIKKKVRPGPFTTSRISYIEKTTKYKFKRDKKGVYFYLVLFTAKK